MQVTWMGIINGDNMDADALHKIILTYRLFQKMMQYPDLLKEMREIFLERIEERGIVSREELYEVAKRAASVEKDKTVDVDEYVGALIDFYFANNFNPVEIENHINLARKMDRFRHLSKVVNMEEATSFRIAKAVKEFCAIPQGDVLIPENEAIGIRVALISHFISNHLPFIKIAKKYITIRDFEELIDRSFWSKKHPGRIGGKAAGMFLAYKVLLPRFGERDPEIEKYVRIPDSYYFNSGIFSDFLDYNDLYQLHSQKYKSRDTIEEEYRQIQEIYRVAKFPPELVKLFRDFLEEVGEHPLILRSSSLLEDHFNYAFSGKYDSVFVANQGDIETRLQEFMWGLKRVHMSILGPAPILYRMDHDLLDFDEKMSVLVQKVTGRRFGDYFFPFCAGVAYSYNTYRWTPRIKKEDGLVRIVFGLGTRAVDRVATDYPRMVPLSHPLLRPEVDANQIRKYSQKFVDVINLNKRRFESIPFVELMKEIDHPDLFYAVSIDQDGHLVAPMFKTQEIDIGNACITFENLLTKTPFVGLMKKILKKLEAAYERPVDVEFAWDHNRLYLLQCRTLPLREEISKVTIPDVPKEELLFANNRVVFNSIIKDIEYIVYVDPKMYAGLSSYDEKLLIGRIVSKINKLMEGKRYALFGPGRWGSNDINLGVRVGYADINRTLILGEIAFGEEGTTPEVSYGTHFFNDLVEARIVPIAIYPDLPDNLFKEEYLLNSKNLLKELLPDFSEFSNVVHIIHVPSTTNGKLLQVYQDGESQEGIGFFGSSEDIKDE